MVGVFEEIIRLGRNYGIGCIMISQRPQSVNKEVLNQTECLFVGQVNGSQERKSLKEWITHQGMDPKLVDELPGLPIGTMYVWSPQWLRILQKVKIAAKSTYDASATPRVGDKTVRRNPAPLDLGEIKTRMAAVIEEEKQNDPKELRKQVRELTRELHILHATPKEAAKVETKTVEKPVLKDGQLERIREIIERIDDSIARAAELVAPVKEALIKVLVVETRAVEDRLAKERATHVLRDGQLIGEPLPSPGIGRQARFEANYGSGALKRATKGLATKPQLAPRHQEIINAIAFYNQIGVEPCNKRMIAGFCTRPFNGNFRTDLSVLRTAALIDYPTPGEVALSEEGHNAVTELPRVRAQADLHALWLNRLQPRHQEILRMLLVHVRGGNAALPKKEVAAEMGREFNGNFRTDLSVLRTLGVIDYPNPGSVAVSKNLFPPLPAR